MKGRVPVQRANGQERRCGVISKGPGACDLSCKRTSYREELKQQTSQVISIFLIVEDTRVLGVFDCTTVVVVPPCPQ